MKSKSIFTVILIFLLLSSSCSSENKNSMLKKNPQIEKINQSLKVVFINNKEQLLRFTVSDTNAISNISKILFKAKEINYIVDTEPDYTVYFYLPTGGTKIFYYWMYAYQNNEAVSIKDEEGNCYTMNENLDAYIANSTKMIQRPNEFVDLYSKCITQSISLLEEIDKQNSIIAIDLDSDIKMKRYTASYEQKSILKEVSEKDYNIIALKDGDNYDYKVSYTTNIYNKDKAEILVNIYDVKENTNKIFSFQPYYEDNKWNTNIKIDE